MTKTDLIEKIAKDAGIPKTTAKRAFESTFESIKSGLKKRNSKVTLVGFGTFKTVYRKTRMGRNPQTGEKIKKQTKGHQVICRNCFYDCTTVFRRNKASSLGLDG